MRTTMGQLLINNALPQELRDYGRTIDKKSIRTLLKLVADRYPDRYNEISHQLMQLGGEVSTTHGREASLSLDSLKLGPNAGRLRQGLNRNVQAILATPGLSHEERDTQIIKVVGRAAQRIRDVNFKEQVAAKNPMALQVQSGARGNPVQFSNVNVGDLLVQDQRDRPIPVALTHSYAEGLDPVEYWAGSYGARKGVVDTKFCVFGITRVRMADGSVKAIKDIVVGDMVLGADYTGVARPVRVLNVFDNGVRACNRYVFRKNATQQYVDLIATREHEVLSEWRSSNAYDRDYTPKLRQLDTARFYVRQDKNQFTAVPARGAPGMGTKHEPRAWIVGLLIGDGCLAPSAHGARLACADPKLLADIKQPLAKLGFKTVLMTKGQYNYHLSEIKTHQKKHQHMHPFRAWLHEIGLWGKLSHEKTLPADVWQWDDASVATLIGGIFSADGCVHVRKNNRVELRLYMTAEAVVRQVCELLEVRFGIYATAIRERPITGDMRHVQYGFAINYDECVRRFAARIPLLGTKRRVLRVALAGASASDRRLGYRMMSCEHYGEVPTFDLEVDHPDHMFVLADGLIVANSTPKGGFLAKQLALAAHRLVVSETDCGTANGIPVEANDPDSVGAVLARNYGSFSAGQVITPKTSKRLKRYETIVVRSPLTCQAKGGVCAKCAGVREKGKLPDVGDNIGIAAAQAIAEPVSQSALSSKHAGGVVGAGPTSSGFDAINQLVQVPKTFRGGATVVTDDGRVDSVEKAPQGGTFVSVAGRRHYVLPDFKPLVEKGDIVEAGDVISEGLPNPSEIVQHKGIGAGRWHFMHNFRETLKASGIAASRRNIELLSRGLINHARIVDEDGPPDSLPGDVVEFNTITRGYTPRRGSKTLAPKRAAGLYLEAPALQYSIGTRVTPRIMADLQKYGVPSITAHKDIPSFAPEMVRAMETISYAPDWMVRLGGFHLKKGLLESVHRGRSAKEHGASYIPALARGVEFGKPPVGSGGVY